MNLFSTSSISLLGALLLHICSDAEARSSGAPICPADRPAPPEGPHGASSGSLAAGSIDITLNNSPLTGTTTLVVGEPVTLTISSSSSWQGVLVRVPGATIDVPSGFREGSGCPDGVGSFTHTNSASKQSVSFTLPVDEPGTNIGLDVNIVRAFSSHFYSQFTLEAVEAPSPVDTETPTAAPTSLPTEQPTQGPTSSPSGIPITQPPTGQPSPRETDAPTMAPSMNMTDTTMAPTSMPTMNMTNITDAPSLAPTSMNVTNTTMAPTSMPTMNMTNITDAPSLAPTSLNVTNTTMAPTSMPTMNMTNITDAPSLAPTSMNMTNMTDAPSLAPSDTNDTARAVDTFDEGSSAKSLGLSVLASAALVAFSFLML